MDEDSQPEPVTTESVTQAVTTRPSASMRPARNGAPTPAATRAERCQGLAVRR